MNPLATVSSDQIQGADIRRLYAVIVFPSENRQQYEDVHKSVWQWVLCLLHDSNVRNYSIYRYGELFVSYME